MFSMDKDLPIPGTWYLLTWDGHHCQKPPGWASWTRQCVQRHIRAHALHLVHCLVVYSPHQGCLRSPWIKIKYQIFNFKEVLNQQISTLEYNFFVNPQRKRIISVTYSRQMIIFMMVIGIHLMKYSRSSSPHLLVIWASRDFSLEKASSRSNSSNWGGKANNYHVGVSFWGYGGSCGSMLLRGSFWHLFRIVNQYKSRQAIKTSIVCTMARKC